VEPSLVRTVAETAAGLGVIGLLVAATSLVALRAITVDDVPGCVRGRIRWWGSHPATVLVASAALTVAGLVALIF